MNLNLSKLTQGVLFFALTLLTACGGGGGGGGAAPAATYTIGGSVTGLTGTGLILHNSNGDSLTVAPGATSITFFTFGTALSNGASYNVAVQAHPTGQICTVSAPSGTVAAANVTTVAVTCATPANTYTISGTITGLTGTGLVLNNSNGDSLTVTPGATSFTFGTALVSGASYNVAVQTHPTGQTCTVSAPSGAIVAANVTNVAVTCTAPTSLYTIGGTVTGLTGTGLVLHNSNGENLTVTSGAASFTFNTALVSGASYDVAVKAQPSGQTCTVGAPSGGTVAAANVTSVVVSCSTTTILYTIGGTVTGLTGTGLVLHNSNGDNLTVVSGATSFTFGTALVDGASYNVAVQSHPIGQTCTVSAPSGTVATANVTTVAVTCLANTYTIGGTVTGLTGTGLVLQNSNGDSLTVAPGATSFTFGTALVSGASYGVTVQTPPSGQTCSVSASSGTVAAANVTTVAVACSTQATKYTIGGTVTGLTGTGLVLLNNSGDSLTVAPNATGFTFSTALVSGANYNVTVQTQPGGQTCTVGAPSGTIATANITTVTVTCLVNTYTIGGNVTGLTGTGLVLLDSGGSGDTAPLSTNGNFVLPTAHIVGYVYFVTVQTQPAGQTCTVTNGIGTVSTTNVTNVTVTCSPNNYTIGGTLSGLTASGLVLLNNGGDNLTIAAYATTFTFSTPIASGTNYNVTVLTQPVGQTCTVNAPSGPVTTANVTTVSVTCSVNTYSVGGTVTGLAGTGLVLQNNGGNNLSALLGGYTFSTPLAYGSTYNVTVLTHPSTPTQLCTVANPTGTVTAAVTNVNVSCVNAYTIGGTITGAAAGIGPILRNNLGDNLFIQSITTVATPFTFVTPVADLSAYSVTQLARARAPSQDCSSITPGGGITGGSGTVSGGPVTSVSITCVLSTVTPRFAYVANSTFNATLLAPDIISSYTIGGTGALTAALTAPTTASGDNPYAIAVDPTGQFAYAVNSNDDSVTVYSIDPTNGFLTVIDANGATLGVQASIATGDVPTAIAIHPSGKFAYVANQGNRAATPTGNTLSAYSINVTSGALSPINADGVNPTIATGLYPYAVTIDPFGKFAYVANYDSNTLSAYTIDPATGVLTPIGSPVAAGTGPSSVAVDPTGKCALVTNNTSNDVWSYTINPTTGALTFATTTTPVALSAPRSVAIDPNTGLYAYVANAGTGTVSAYSLTLATCAITPINADGATPALTIAAGTTPLSINVDPSGQFVYVANFGSNNISVYSIIAGALAPVETRLTGAGPTSVITTQ